jgi:hypothetical protein
MPICAYVGTTPISSEPPEIIMTANATAALRPCRSANAPITHPPRGRIRNPAQKIP